VAPERHRARVERLLGTVGLPAAAAARTTIAGDDPVLPSRFPIGEAAAAALAAAAAAAAHVHELRTGTAQDVHVDVADAAAALCSHALQRLDGAELHPATDALAGLFQTRDGRHIQLFGSFPHLANGTLAVLGARALARDAVAAAVARRDGLELEQALAAAGMCGALVRTPLQWRTHPQGRAIAHTVPIAIERLGAAPPTPLPPAGERPLGGVRVLEATRILAGPSVGKLLAEHGAEVMLVSCSRLPNPRTCVLDTGVGKLATELDLDTATGVAALRALVVQADVFVQSYRAGALERRGLGPRELAALRPGLVYVTVNTYGDGGPWRRRPGWEPLAEAATGISLAEGGAGPPRVLPAAACDYTTGYLGALAVIAALERRAREGGSHLVRASLCQTGMWIEALGAHCDPAAASGLPDLADRMLTADTIFGRLTHLAPVARLSATPGRWSRPVVPPGTHPPAWPSQPGSGHQ
jgi:crotonobetainyl-CoA:carnitine CoA-transferase CaiB-like acyl-CoA transferase